MVSVVKMTEARFFFSFLPHHSELFEKKNAVVQNEKRSILKHLSHLHNLPQFILEAHEDGTRVLRKLLFMTSSLNLTTMN